MPSEPRQEPDTQAFDELRRWPYTIYAIDDTLDTGLIEGRARQLLYQALNSSNLVAFVGSGASAGYGRLSWTEWSHRQRKMVTDRAKKVIAVLKKSIERLEAAEKMFALAEKNFELTDDLNSSRQRTKSARAERNFRLSRLKGLYNTMDAVDETDAAIGGDVHPIRFQIAEQMHELLRGDFEWVIPNFEPTEQFADNDKLKALIERDDWKEADFKYGKLDDELRALIKNFAEKANHEAADGDFHAASKAMLRDEVYYSKSMLVAPMGALKKHGREKAPGTEEYHAALRETMKLGIGVAPSMSVRDNDGEEYFKTLGYYTLGAFLRLRQRLRREEIAEPWRYLVEALTIAAPPATASGKKLDPEHHYIPAVDRYLVAMAMSLVAQPWSGPRQRVNPFRPQKPALYEAKKPDRSNFSGRLSVVSENADALQKLSLGLNIRNFLTVNYDIEIERLFFDRGYIHKESGDLDSPLVTRTDGFGGRAAMGEFRRENATDLIAFSLDALNADMGVFHLHGAADRENKLVITERDYMDLYLRDDAYRDIVDDAIKVAFSSSTLLFVGLGMDEADVLRPLRQFMSDRERVQARTAVALYPAIKSHHHRVTSAATLYLRYGVHIAYFGDAQVRLHDGTMSPVFDWLHRITLLIDELRRRNRDLRDMLRELLDKPVVGETSKKEQAFFDQKTDRLARIESAVRAESSKSPEPVCYLARLFGRTGIGEIDLGTDRIRQPFFERDAALLRPDSDRTEPKTSMEHELTVISTVLRLTIGPNDIRRFENKREAKKQASLDYKTLSDSKEQAEAQKTDAERERHRQKMERERHRRDMERERHRGGIRPLLRDANARLVALDGAQNAVMTRTLCNALDDLEADWDEWWKQWRASPPHRVARFATHKLMQAGFKRILPLCYLRHRVDPILTDLSRAHDAPTRDLFAIKSDKRKMGTTDVRSFDNFLDAVETRAIADRDAGKLGLGRRMHLVAAERGLGKGSFMSAFVTRRALDQYIASSWPTTGGTFRPAYPLTFGAASAQPLPVAPPHYLSAIFINLSFSSEIASTYDALADALTDHLVSLDRIRRKITSLVSDKGSSSVTHADYRDVLKTAVEEQLSRPGSPAWVRESRDREFVQDAAMFRAQSEMSALGVSRLRHLRALLAGMTDHAVLPPTWQPPLPVAPTRCLIVINAADLMFFGGGRPKNRETTLLLELLTGEDMAQVPFDIVLVSHQGYLGEPFHRRGGGALPQTDGGDDGRRAGTPVMVPMTRKNIPIRGIERVHAAETLSGIRLEGRTVPRPDAIRGQERHSADPVPLPSNVNTDRSCNVYFAREMRPDNYLIENFKFLPAYFHVAADPESVHRDAVKQYDDRMDKINKALGSREPNPFSGRSHGELLSELRASDDYFLDADKFEAELAELAPPKADAPVPALAYELRLKVRNAFLKEVCGSTESDAAAIETDIQNALHARLQARGRKISAVREWQQFRRSLNANRFCMTILLAAAERVALSGENLADGTRRAEILMRRTMDHASSVGEANRETAVLHHVLDAYEAFHRIGDAQNDNDLHLLILRHVAVIGMPVSADVLARAPEIRRHLKDCYPDGKWTRVVFHALHSLVNRGLIFRIEPHPRLVALKGILKEDLSNAESDEARERAAERERELMQGRDPDYEHRYAVHRVVQLHIMRKLGAGPRPFGQINTFAPTLYAAMPSDVPRLTYEAFVFMENLVASLSQNPDRSSVATSTSDATAPEGWVFANASLATRVQALRAALSVVRSSFSVSAVSRFSDYSGTSAALARQRGFFEIYRIQVRWIIRKAFELLDDEYKTNFDEYDPTAEFKQINALYRDEIVWLYNECGVINLVQGNLRDSIGLLRQAIEFNRDIEGPNNDGPQHNRISLNLAVAQIERGRINSARNRLRRVQTTESDVKGPIYWLAHGYGGLTYHLSGDLSIAQQHYEAAIGELRILSETRASSVLCRHYGALLREMRDHKNAKARVDEGIGFAQAGGHEDEHHRCLLAKIVCERDDPDLDTSNDRLGWFSRLEKIERYAQVMEMPSLLCDVHVVRARILVTQGETKLAGSLTARAMARAKRHDMGLRLVTAMTLYAHILIAQGLQREANSLLLNALDVAKRYGNQLQIHRIEDIIKTRHGRPI